MSDADFLTAIRSFVTDHGYPPTRAELVEATGLSRGQVERRASAMMIRGWVEQKTVKDGEVTIRPDFGTCSYKRKERRLFLTLIASSDVKPGIVLGRATINETNFKHKGKQMLKTPSELPTLLTESETAEILRIKKETLSTWRFAKRYDLPWIKVGSRVFYDRAEVAAYIERQRQSARH